MPKITVYSTTPYVKMPGYFTNIPGEPTFDPKHPVTYPGHEVVAFETLSVGEAVAKYGREPMEPYTVVNPGTKNAMVTIWRYTGKTSAEVFQESL